MHAPNNAYGPATSAWTKSCCIY